jgi:hypothetical protein
MIQTNPFKISEQDYIKLSFAQAYRQPTIIGMSLVAPFWLYFGLTADETSWILLGFSSFVLVLIPASVYWGGRTYYKSQKTLQDTHIYTFEKSTISFSGSYSKGDFTWDIVKKAENRAEWVLLYTSNRLMHPIPQKAFKDGDLVALKTLLDSIPVKNTLKL